MANEIARTTLVLLLCAIGGCVGTSIRPDLDRAFRLAETDPPSESILEPARSTTSEEVRAMLREELDAEAIVRIAVANNRELRARLEELGIARGRVVQAGLSPNPTVEAEVLPERETRLELALEYDLTDLVLAPARARAARAELDAARFDVAGDIVELGYEARAAFHAVAAAERKLAVGHQVLDTLAASRDAANALFESGNANGLDVASEVAAYERARLDVAALELDVAEARERLRRVLGVYGADASFAIAESLEVGEDPADVLEGIEARAIESSLELRALASRIESIARRSGIARAEGVVPDVSLDMHILHGRPDNPSSGPADAALRFGGGATVSIPLFDRNQGDRASLRAELEAARERYYGLAVDLRSFARESAARLRSVYARARHLEQVVRPATERVLEETRLRYNAMQIDAFRLLAARRERLDVELAYVDSLRDLAIARAAVHALLAGRRVELATLARTSRIEASSSSEGGH